MHKIPKFQYPAGPIKKDPSLIKTPVQYFQQTTIPKFTQTNKQTEVFPGVMKQLTPKPLNTADLGYKKLDTKSLFEKNKLLKNISGAGVKDSTYMPLIGQGLDIANTLLPSANEDPTTNAINQGYSAVSDVLMSVPGYGQLIGGAMKLTSLGNKALASVTGGASTIKDPTTTADKILSSDLFGLSPIGLLNAFSKTKVKGTDQDIANVAQAYGGVNTIKPTEIGGVSKAWSWLTGSKNKAKQRKATTNLFNLQNIQKAEAVKAAQREMTAAGNTTQDIISKNYQKLTGGLGTNILAAKEGLKLIMNKTRFLQSGGSFNVIPSGALHKELNHLDGDHTRKGIPVLLEEEGGKITQQAEIERDEIILNLELTKKLEELLKQFEEGDELAAIEAGKLLTYEILENTVDNTGITNKIE